MSGLIRCEERRGQKEPTDEDNFMCAQCRNPQTKGVLGLVPLVPFFLMRRHRPSHQVHIHLSGEIIARMGQLEIRVPVLVTDRDI